jgi:transcriptional regulator with XRE-family HTH domain
MRNARNRAGLSLNETAELLGIAPSTLSDYEFGHQEPDLPVVEALARLCHLSVAYFWSDDPLPSPDRKYATQKAISLRRKIVGGLLNKARNEAGYSREKVAEFLNCPVDRIASYELGKTALPLSQLESLTSFLNVDLAYFLNGGEEAKQAPAPQKQPQPRPIAPPVAEGVSEDFSHLSPEVYTFLKDPVNMVYLKLAMSLHNLSADTLRTLAEGILDITY